MPENIHDKCEIVNDIPDDMYPILDLESGFDLLTYDDIQVWYADFFLLFLYDRHSHLLFITKVCDMHLIHATYIYFH